MLQVVPERLEIEAAEHPDDGVRSEREKREVEEGLPRDAANLHELEVLRLELCSESAAHLVDVDVLGVQRGSQEWREGRSLEVGEHVRQLVVAERAPRLGESRVLAGSQQREADQLGPIGELAAGVRLHRSGGQVAEAPTAIGSRHDAVEVDPAQRDAAVVEEEQLLPEIVRLVRREFRRVGCRERRAVGADHDQGVAVVGHARGDHFRDAHTGASRQVGHEPFVLDVLTPTGPSGALVAPIPKCSPEARGELALPRVAAVDPDLDRTALVGSFEHGYALATDVDRVDALGGDAEILKRGLDPRDCRKSARRAAEHVDEVSGEQSDRERGHRAEGL